MKKIYCKIVKCPAIYIIVEACEVLAAQARAFPQLTLQQVVRYLVWRMVVKAKGPSMILKYLYSCAVGTRAMIIKGPGLPSGWRSGIYLLVFSSEQVP